MDGVSVEVLLAGWKPSNEARALCESVRGKRRGVGVARSAFGAWRGLARLSASVSGT